MVESRAKYRYATRLVSSLLVVLVLHSSAPTQAFHSLAPPASATRVQRTHASTTMLHSTRSQGASALMQDMRAEISKNEDANLMLQALRGQNLNDDDAAVAGLQMRLVTIAAQTDEETGLPYEYNPAALKAFFRQRPMAVVTRIVQLLSVGGGFAVTLALDFFFKRTARSNDLEVQRAAEFRDLLTSLGPFYIKIGQALSIRPDVLSPRSMVELQKLCDKVSSYDSTIAFAMIESELGRTIVDVFSQITPEPVAAASLGQVYKATLRESGDVVAVKVQRPGVLETVSLDLYLAREIGLFVRKIPALVETLDPVALLDEFAYRFYQELDYNLECLNGIRIAKDMSVLPMVVIPKNYPSYTARRVHVAEWIEGEKLSQSTADNVSSLVNLGVVVYLQQLLGPGGLFHADPHPGNMLRTADGKLAILDFGLMTEVTEDQKYGMIEAIAHLINRDYTEIGQDFINLDFIPKGTDTRPIVPALTKVFDVALAGGGAKSINFQELAADLSQITYDYPFRIPPYFALVIRAISVLEGIALVGNPNFAIIDEAYPYIARRLMTDPSPRLRAALRYMIYGRNGVFDAENAIDLLQALEKFTAVKDKGDGSAFKVDGVRGNKNVGSAGDFRGSQKVDTTERDADGRFRLSSSNNDSAMAGAPLLVATNSASSESQDDERTVRDALRFFFSTDGQVFRDFMLEEIVSVLDASGRGAIQELSRSLGLSNFPIPGFVRAINPDITEKDRNNIQQIRKLFQFLMGEYEQTATTTRLRQLVPIAREYAPQLLDFGLLLGARLTEKNLSRGMNWATDQLSRSDTSRTFSSARI